MMIIGLAAYMVGFGLCVTEWSILVPAFLVGIVGIIMMAMSLKK